MIVVALLLAVVAACGAVVYELQRRELAAIRARVRQGSELSDTPAGVIEYASRGEVCAQQCRPVLAIHGVGGGYDQGLMIAAGRELLARLGIDLNGEA